MSQVRVSGNASGTGIFTIVSPNSNTNQTLTLPDSTGTILTTTSPKAGNVLQVLQVCPGSFAACLSKASKDMKPARSSYRNTYT